MIESFERTYIPRERRYETRMSDTRARKLLGITQAATKKDASKAFRILSKKYHPDRHRNKTQTQQEIANKKMKLISEAWSTVKEPKREA